MGWLKQSHEKSLLGQLLVRQKLITEEQLARAIAHQRQTGQRLGDILAEWNLLTQSHLQQALRKQRNLRTIAALAAAMFAPLEALAATPAPLAQISAPPAESGLRALSEDDLGQVAARGLPDELLRHDGASSRGGGAKVLGKMVAAMNPMLDFLEADTTIRDVAYDPAHAKAVLNRDGSLTLSMPSSIGEISFDNIRVKGDTSGASFGSISIRNIDFTGTTVTVSAIKR